MGGPVGRPAGVPRRRVLAALALAPVVLGGCSLLDPAEPEGPDPLITLADAARADAALAAAVTAADPALAGRVDPLAAARTEHAAALDAEIARRSGDDVAPTPAPTPPPSPDAGGLADLRSALEASGAAAAALALDLPAERVGVVASISACCTTYAAVLG